MATAPAQEPLPDRYATGTHAFRALLHRAGVKPLDSFDDLDESPGRKVAIVLGTTGGVLPRDRRAQLEEFAAAGGAVLIATDTPTPGLFGVIVTNEEPVTDGMAKYRDMPECPLVGGNAAPFVGLPLGLATNKPATVYRKGDLPVMAQFRYPGSIRLLTAVPFAAGGRVNTGRALVMADHSVFINSMMLQTDNDNIPFAVALIDWLTEGRRTEALFVEDGVVQTTFDVPLDAVTPPPIPPEEVLIPLANRVLVGLEQEGVFDRLIMNLLPYGPLQLFRIALLVLTILLAMYGILRMVSARRRVDPATPRLPARLDALDAIGGDPDGLAFGHAARELAREAFAALGHAPRPGQPPPGSRRGWWRGDRTVTAFWTLAADGPTKPWTASELKRLHVELRLMRDAVAAGRLTLVRPEETA